MRYCVSALAYDHPDSEPTLHTRHADSMAEARKELSQWQQSPPSDLVLFEIWEGEYNEGQSIEVVEQDILTMGGT